MKSFLLFLLVITLATPALANQEAKSQTTKKQIKSVVSNSRVVKKNKNSFQKIVQKNKKLQQKDKIKLSKVVRRKIEKEEVVMQKEVVNEPEVKLPEANSQSTSREEIILQSEAVQNAVQNDDAKEGAIKTIIDEDGMVDLQKTLQIFLPKVSNRLIAGLSFDDNYQSTNRKNEFKSTSGSAKLFSTFSFSQNLFLKTYFSLSESSQASERVRRNQLPQGGGDRSFENLGISMQEFILGYNGKRTAIVGGKFILNFGNAWRWNHGIWTYDVANNYKFSEKLGINAMMKAGNLKKTGHYNFGFAAFTNDRKNFDNSVITNRDSASRSDAKPGDTRSLESYLASLDINFNFDKHEQLFYHFAYANLAVDGRQTSVSQDKVGDQKSFVANMMYRIPIRENLKVETLLEYAKTKNLGGNSNIFEDYLTIGISGKIYRNWNLTLASAEHRNIEVGTNGTNRNVSEISVGYEFYKNAFFDKLLIQVGYKNQRTNRKTSLESDNVFGAIMRYTKNF